MTSRQHSPILIAIAVGLAGGIARYLDDVLHHGRRFALVAMAAALVTAAFFGWLCGEVAVAMGRTSWTYAAAGLGGFMGTQTLDLALSVFRNRLRLDPNNPNNPAPTDTKDTKS